MPRLRRLFLLVTWYALLSAWPAVAQDLVVARAFIADPTGRLTVEDVRQRTPTPYAAFLNEGYTGRAFWVRLTIQGVPAATDQPAEPGAGWAIVRMRPTFVDQIELFDPADVSGRRRLAGDRHEWALSEHPSLAHAFVVPVGPVPRDLWLRVQTTSARQFDVEVLPWQVANQRDRMDELRSALLLMLLVALALIGLVAAIASQTHTDTAFAAMQAANLPYAMYVLGYLRPLTSGVVSAPTLDVAFSLAVFVGVHVACWFYYYFINEHRPSPIGRRLVTLPLFLLPILLVLTIAGQLELALHINAYSILVLPIMVFAAGTTCSAWDRGAPVTPALPRWLFSGALGVAAAGSTLWFANAYGLMQSSALLLYGMIWFTALIGAVMLTVLLVRTRRLASIRADALLRAQIAESEAVQAANQRAEHAELLSLLSHEVKSGLSVIRLVVTTPSATDELRAVAEDAIDGIGRILDRVSDLPHQTEPELFAITATPVRPLLDQVRAEAAQPARVTVWIEEATGPVVTDRVTLRRLLALLIDNGLQHGAGDAPVDLSAAPDRRQDGGLLIWVTNLPGDSGWPDPDGVFTKYYRSPGARRLKGSGLGLHLAATLATQLGGTLKYAPTATHVRFMLWLPG